MALESTDKLHIYFHMLFLNCMFFCFFGFFFFWGGGGGGVSRVCVNGNRSFRIRFRKRWIAVLDTPNGFHKADHTPIWNMYLIRISLGPIDALRTKGRHFVITGGTGSCHYNLRCNQSRQSCQIDDRLFSVAHWPGDKALSEPMMNLFATGSMRH